MDFFFSKQNGGISPRTRIAKLHLQQQKEMKALKQKQDAELKQLHAELDHKNAKESAALKKKMKSHTGGHTHT